ncbi:Probable RNA-directed DNA polymerase from transposon BS [Eumeta japonica]|uniref:Probable RNA-directed DNA polymerase from transposon BS n=1 Tax=Eumeta variegata TaxID=151549 RepID=A0A4C2AHU0_EUMVA|nr:Probable RNA-directed DNA polymerase from transposon BS [Eumeta japonica]
MEAFAEDIHFNIIPPLSPTLYHNNDNYRPDILDIALIKVVALKLSCIETLQCLNSDHRPVLMRLSSLAGNCPPPKKTITSWQKVSAALEETDTPILNNIPNDIISTDHIDYAIGALTNHITTVVENSTRVVPAKSDRKELPSDVSELIRAKNAALRRASKYPTCENRSHARALQREVKARMKEVRNENWSDLMSEISPSHRAYWGLAKALKTEGAVPTPALKKPDSLKRSTTGKKLTWKEAVVIGIPKPGKPRDLPASYRPISLLSVLGKLFEKTLKTRLSDHLIGKGLIINEQFGFKPNHSCPQQALRLIEYISNGFKVKRKTVAVFFDVAKAFDRVWHAGLKYKLYKLELPDRLVIIIHHYISNRHFSFRLDNTYSSMRPIRAGVPQGSTLSPLLYSAYVNDIPRPSTGVQLALFADDTALYLRSNCIRNILPRLQRAIDELTQWLRLWRIDVNPEKSASIYFDYSPQKLQFPVPIDTPPSTHVKPTNSVATQL